MKIFLDTSVLLAAAGSASGASRAIFDFGLHSHWDLVTSLYCVEEVNRNLCKLPIAATGEWRARLQPRLMIVRETLVHDRPLLFIKTKDKPILLTALAEQCDVLLTLDRQDFSDFLDTSVYRLWVRTPATFLAYERDRGLLP
ncbi:MAG: PIN domain-containing protein [bacterium]